MIQTLEDAIIARYAAKLPELENTSYPDNPDNYHLEHPVAALLTRYESTGYTQPLALDIVEQDATFTFTTVVVTRGYTGDGGAKAIIKRVIEAVRGHRVPGFSKFYITKVDLLQVVEGIWQYSVGIACVSRESELEDTREQPDYDPETGEWNNDIPLPD